MLKWLKTAGDAGKAAWNIASSIGPLVISQSDQMSKAYVRHQSRLAGVEASREFISREIQNYTGVQKILLEKWVDAAPEERLRIRRDLDEIGATMRQFDVAEKAIGYLAEGKEAGQGQPLSESQTLSPHWLDKFNELARVRNEPWRAELLARAFATEASVPGSITPRALWVLGILEKRSFDAFSIILNVASLIDNKPIIPNHVEFEREEIPSAELDGHRVNIANLIFYLHESGLVADIRFTRRVLHKDGEYPALYGESKHRIGCRTDLRVQGVILTEMGESVASFHEPAFNPLGKKIFDAWLASLDRNHFQVTP